MAVTYGFYDSLNGDRKYNADQMDRIFQGLISDGIYQSVGETFVVSAATGMNVNVGRGRAWLINTWTFNDTFPLLQVAIPASHATLNRIDTVVIEVDKTNRINTVKVITGTPNASPVAPTLTSTTLLKQAPLADVYVGAAVTSITAGNITNRVGVVGGTPFVTSIVTNVDPSTLFGQYQANFEAWFANLQNELNTSQASNLQNQIDQITSGWIVAGETWTYSASDAPSYTFLISGDKTGKYKTGYRVKFTQTTIKYGIITKVAYSSPNTTVTIYCGTDYSLANAAITSPYWSPYKAPFGFPLERSKWTVTLTDSSSRSSGVPTQNQWYNMYSVDLPLGAWIGDIYFLAEAVAATSIVVAIFTTLATTTAVETDTSFTRKTQLTNTDIQAGHIVSGKNIVLTAKTTHYVNVKTNQVSGTNLLIRGDLAPSTIQLVCSYL